MTLMPRYKCTECGHTCEASNKTPMHHRKPCKKIGN